MKKICNKIILLSALLVASACNNVQPSKRSTSEQESSIFSSADLSTVTSSSSNYSKSSSSSNKPSSASSSNTSSSVDPSIKENELYTSSGLSIKFKATGASIDKINFKNKQIAKDGFVVGRCANRIANGKFGLDGVNYSVSINASPHSLHGGAGTGMNSWRGPFATKDWTKVEQTRSSITYSIHSADEENGYPGNMDMTVTYTLSEEGELSIEYRATTDKTTLCNPTNHLFMSPNGNNSYSDIKLWINADNYTPLNNQIPTGQIATVEGTQFDFRTEKTFDSSKNYDDNLVLNGEGYRKVATMKGTSLGVQIDVFTDRPGLQLYKDGSGSICLETQMFPDAINQRNFEDPVIRPGEQFYSKTSYVFSEI